MKHAVVFVDHHVAHIHFPDGTSSEPAGKVFSAQPAHGKDGHRQPLDRKALEWICSKVKEAEEILLVGPGTAKHELKSWLAEHHPEVDRRVVGVETVDHPTAGELKNLALTAFRRIDAWL